MTRWTWTGWNEVSDWFSHCSRVDPSGILDNAREESKIKKKESWEIEENKGNKE